jgi:hypothetical protein
MLDDPRLFAVLLFFASLIAAAIVWAIVSNRRTEDVAPPLDALDAGPRLTVTASFNRRIRSKVVGVSQRNADGQRREDIIIKHVQVGDSLVLLREPDNRYDPNAVQVWSAKEPAVAQIGYLKKELAADLAPLLDADVNMFVTVTARTGDQEVDTDGDDDYSAGVNIAIEYDEPLPL